MSLYSVFGATFAHTFAPVLSPIVILPFAASSASFSASKVTVIYVSGTGLSSDPLPGLSFSGFSGSAGIHGTIGSLVYLFV